jgi:hypothetical protein
VDLNPIIDAAMRVDSPVARILTEAAVAPEATKQSLQVATLKKALDSQKQEASEMLKLLEPKGRVIDIRV